MIMNLSELLERSLLQFYFFIYIGVNKVLINQSMTLVLIVEQCLEVAVLKYQ
jgi:hypothetical protein